MSRARCVLTCAISALLLAAPSAFVYVLLAVLSCFACKCPRGIHTQHFVLNKPNLRTHTHTRKHWCRVIAIVKEAGGAAALPGSQIKQDRWGRVSPQIRD